MAQSVSEKSQALVARFAAIPDWEARYKAIIEEGRRLAPMPEELHTEDNKVKGCQSQVWLSAKLNDGKIEFQADSDALIVKGLIAVLLAVYSDASPQDVLSHPPEFLKTLGFEGNLSPSRANGLNSMVKQIRNYAVAFDFLLKSQKTR